MRYLWLLCCCLAPTAAEPPVREVTGLLTEVEAGVQMIRLARGTTTLSFRLDAATIVLVDDAPATLAALTVDQPWRVEYLADGQPPYRARRLLDQATVRLREAENTGVAATIVTIEERGQGDGRTVVVSVDTALGRRRELLVRPTGAYASRILRDGQPATATDFRPGEAVIVALRRTSGPALHLKALADPPTYRAWLADRTLTGRLVAMTATGELTLTVADRPEPVRVRLLRGAVRVHSGAVVEGWPYQPGDEVTVKYQVTDHGLVLARALFDPASWRFYGELAERP